MVSDVFALGMIFLQLIVGKEEVKDLYNLENRTFDYEKFEQLKD